MALNKKIEELGKDINFIKYQFTDMQGNIREVTLSKETVKNEGYTSVDGSSVFGKIIPPTESDMLLIPDPETLVKIPWKEDCARVICNVYHPPKKEGEKAKPFEGCPRSILSNVEKGLEKSLSESLKGKKVSKYHAHFAPELEFILLDKDYAFEKIHLDQSLENKNYFVSPTEKVDKTLKQITKSLSDMGIKKEKYHTEVTTYQYEIGIGHGNVLSMADATMTAKFIIQNVAQINGLRASFIPKFRKGVNGNGMHVHQNLAATIDDKEMNIFFDESEKDGLSDIGKGYIAGLLKYAKEITAITNPEVISYKRLVPGCEAPTYIAWDWQNRTALCRGHSQATHKIRVEYRAPDPTCNPYLAFGAMLSAGLSGIEEKLKLPKPNKKNFYHDNKGVEELPANLGEAVELMGKSGMLKKRLGNFTINSLYEMGNRKWSEYCQIVSDADIKMCL